MAGKRPDLGSTALTVADNVKLLREAQNMNYTQLSDRLKAVADWSINAVGIRRIEAGERRVNPDDLVALALALGVSPITLLMPSEHIPATKVAVTGLQEEVEAGRLWNWLRAENQLIPSDTKSRIGFILGSRPKWEQDKWLERASADASLKTAAAESSCH